MQTVTLTHGLLGEDPLEQSDPFTEMGSTLTRPPPPPVTVRGVEPEMPPDSAMIVVVPVPTEVALPLLPATLLMVATDGTDELQVADVVRSCVVLSEKVPVALNGWVVPRAMLGFAGVTAMETNVIGVEPLPPPPPPQPAITARSSKGTKRLFDLIDTHTRRDQARHIGPSLQIPHVSPHLHNNVIRHELLTRTSD